MIDKIKAFVDSVKGVLLTVIAPIIALLAYISYLREKNTTLTDQINQSKAAAQLATVLEKKVEDEKQSNVDELDYDTLRAQYIANHPSEFVAASKPLPSEGTNVQSDNQSSGQDHTS